MTLKVDWLRGCATALVTPFTSEGAVDDRRLRDLIEYQLTGGVKVLVPCGAFPSARADHTIAKGQQRANMPVRIVD